MEGGVKYRLKNLEPLTPFAVDLTPAFFLLSWTKETQVFQRCLVLACISCPPCLRSSMVTFSAAGRSRIRLHPPLFLGLETLTLIQDDF